MIVPETYHVPFCATHAQTFFASEQTPRQNECAGLSHARIVSTREGLVFPIETTARQNGGNLNSLCLFSFCDDSLGANVVPCEVRAESKHLV